MPWPPGRSAGSSPRRGPRRPRALLAHAAGRRDPATSASDAPDPQDRAVGRARVPEVDAREDRPRVIALRVEERLRDLPLAGAGGLQMRQVMEARLGPRNQLAVLVEERRHRGLEALGIPAVLVRTRSLGHLRALIDALRRLFPVLLRSEEHTSE